jgi:Tfp pilus assembly pilus retraction ATPase PilT
MRILDKSNTLLGLDKLISHAPSLALVREMIGQPYGIVYVTGPTGSAAILLTEGLTTVEEVTSVVSIEA